jgi:hypothetical protein
MRQVTSRVTSVLRTLLALSRPDDDWPSYDSYPIDPTYERGGSRFVLDIIDTLLELCVYD